MNINKNFSMKGWFNDSWKHSLASKGISSKVRIPKKYMAKRSVVQGIKYPFRYVGATGGEIVEKLKYGGKGNVFKAGVRDVRTKELRELRLAKTRKMVPQITPWLLKHESVQRQKQREKTAEEKAAKNEEMIREQMETQAEVKAESMRKGGTEYERSLPNETKIGIEAAIDAADVAAGAQNGYAAKKERPISIRTTKRYVRERMVEPSEFKKGSFRTIDPGRKGHTKLIVGRLKGKKTTSVQAVLHEKDPRWMK